MQHTLLAMQFRNIHHIVPIATIVGSRLFTWLSSPSGNMQPDSESYLPSNWLNFEKVSFLGESTRGWIIPFIYSLLPSNEIRNLLQLILGSIAWVVVVLATDRFLKNTSFRIPNLIFISITASSANLLQFENVFLATSFYVNFTLFFVVLFLWMLFKNDFSVKKLLLITILAWLITSLKLISIITVIPLMLFLTWQIRRIVKRKVLIIFVVFNIVLLCQSMSAGINNDRFWKNSYSGTATLWHLGEQSPSASQFKLHLEEIGAPRCLTRNAPFSDIAAEMSVISRECSEGVVYLQDKIQGEFIRFILLNPQVALNLVAVGTGITFTSTASNYASVVTPIPRELSNMIFGNSSPDFRTIGVSDQGSINNRTLEPIWAFVPGLFLAILGIFLPFFSRNKSAVNQGLFLVSSLSFSQIIITTVILPSEWFRQNIQSLIALYVTSFLTLALYFSKFTFANSKTGPSQP